MDKRVLYVFLTLVLIVLVACTSQIQKTGKPTDDNLPPIPCPSGMASCGTQGQCCDSGGAPDGQACCQTGDDEFACATAYEYVYVFGGSGEMQWETKPYPCTVVDGVPYP
ncbi:hypothetical protein J4464_04705 [Candidatus Woesearchaeota archaeon]|nr:hypothetical protein [Candidatus Woesearchaeota archaeon]